MNVVEVQQIEKEPSAFDEYDRENGYEDDWKRTKITAGKHAEKL